MRFPWGRTVRRVRPKPSVQIPFIGHEELLTTLATHLQTAQDGPAQFVAVIGESGSGKTALLEEFVFRHCSKPQVLLLQLNAATCLLAHEVYAQLCHALQQRSEQMLQIVFNATKHLRKTLALQWEEDEFRHMLAAAEWSQHLPTSSSQGRSRRGRSGTPLAQLLESVQEHPWVLGAAALLAQRARPLSGTHSQKLWEQRWLLSLKALASRAGADPGVLVILIDQMVAPRFTPAHQEVSEQPDWQAFATALGAVQLPTLLIWAGTATSLAPVQHALQGQAAYSQYQMPSLQAEEQQQFSQALVRTLPRARQPGWQQVLATPEGNWTAPGRLLFATTSVAVMQPDARHLARLAQSDIVTLVGQLVEHLQKSPNVTAPLARQVLSLCAFMPPNAPFVVDDILPWCDFATLGLDIAAGRAQLETLLSHWVKYGLLFYDSYRTRYTLGHGAVQEALQCIAYPDATLRRQMAEQWALAATILRHVRQGEREGLPEVASVGQALYGAALRERLAPTVVESFRRLLPMSSKEERQRMAYALGGFGTELAVDMLRALLQDEDGQVRSCTVQSLADLTMAAAFPGLLEALRDRNSDVRWIATRALGHMSGAQAVDALIPMLTDEDQEVGRIAAQGLGHQGDSRAVPHLIAATRDDYPLLRESAVVALGQLADRRAVPALQDVLRDTHQQVRRSAEMALARFTASSGG